MSEIAKLQQFNPVSAQPPLRWYFDPKVLEIEQRVLLDAGPQYVGHELMVPNLGDYHVIEWMDKAKMLVRNENGVELLSNICRHRQATMLEGRGTAKNIVCPLHRWTYENSGELIGAPHFPQNPCLHLNKTPLQNWNGLLFAGKRDVAKDLANMPAFKEIDFSGYMLDRVEIDEYNFNWKTFIEVYQEDYHVVPFHPGLGQFVDCDDLQWTFGEHFSVQTVGINHALKKSGSPTYAKWAQQVLRYNNGELPKYGAIWLTYYPNITVEWYPTRWWSARSCHAARTPVPTSSSSTIRKTSCCSSATTSRPRSRPTARPLWKMISSACACIRGAVPCTNRASKSRAPTSHRPKTACCTTMNSCVAI
jgi:phenylpropionate dioxygenase-like ring-hydroxylating dioxygenase large terminal subunit